MFLTGRGKKKQLEYVSKRKKAHFFILKITNLKYMLCFFSLNMPKHWKVSLWELLVKANVGQKVKYHLQKCNLSQEFYNYIYLVIDTLIQTLSPVTRVKLVKSTHQFWLNEQLITGLCCWVTDQQRKFLFKKAREEIDTPQRKHSLYLQDIDLVFQCWTLMGHVDNYRNWRNWPARISKSI